MKKVFLEIKTCEDCPHKDTERFYTADSWEYVESWLCKKTDRPATAKTDAMPYIPNSNLIAQVEKQRDKPKEIPSWCPLRK